MKQKFKGLVILTLVTLTIFSCTRTVYNVRLVDNTPKCDSTSGQLFVRVLNKGKFGISSIRFKTDSGYVNLAGINPGKTTCYFSVGPVYKIPGYTIDVVSYNTFGKPKGDRITGVPIDHNGGENKIVTGYYTLTIEVLYDKDGNLDVKEFELYKD